MSKIKADYLTCGEVAKKLGFTSDYIRRLIARGKIKAVRHGFMWMIAPIAIKDIKRQRKSSIKEV